MPYSAVLHCVFEMISLNSSTACVVITYDPSIFLKPSICIRWCKVQFKMCNRRFSYPTLMSWIKLATRSSGTGASFGFVMFIYFLNNLNFSKILRKFVALRSLCNRIDSMWNCNKVFFFPSLRAPSYFDTLTHVTKQASITVVRTLNRSYIESHWAIQSQSFLRLLKKIMKESNPLEDWVKKKSKITSFKIGNKCIFFSSKTKPQRQSMRRSMCALATLRFALVLWWCVVCLTYDSMLFWHFKPIDTEYTYSVDKSHFCVCVFLNQFRFFCVSFMNINHEAK